MVHAMEERIEENGNEETEIDGRAAHTDSEFPAPEMERAIIELVKDTGKKTVDELRDFRWDSGDAQERSGNDERTPPDDQQKKNTIHAV